MIGVDFNLMVYSYEVVSLFLKALNNSHKFLVMDPIV